jgi:hypothetical protein
MFLHLYIVDLSDILSIHYNGGGITKVALLVLGAIVHFLDELHRPLGAIFDPQGLNWPQM